MDSDNHSQARMKPLVLQPRRLEENIQGLLGITMYKSWSIRNGHLFFWGAPLEPLV